MRLCPCAGARPCFNPRTHEGRDLAIRTSPSCVRTFQSTRPRGARRPRIAAGRGQISVSIHAPTRGATSSGRRHERPSGVSIHAPTRGATPFRWFFLTTPILFQSTRPRGARRSPVTSHVRPQLVSIHAPTRGATARLERLLQHPSVSIHAPTRGATPRQHAGYDRIRVSIHAPTRGATAKVNSDMHDTSALIRFSRTDEPMIREFCNQDKWQQEKLREPPTLSPSLGVRAATAYLKCIKSPLGHRHH